MQKIKIALQQPQQLQHQENQQQQLNIKQTCF
jgi:hypothetical protein